MGEAQAAEVIIPEDRAPGPVIRRLSSSQDDERGKKLLDVVQLQGVPELNAEQLRTFLANNHNVFSLQPGERGDTSLVTMAIDTADEPPQKQPPRRMAFKVREEVARQLRDMQCDGVIQPSNLPWSSPVVMFREKDGSHRFCVEYIGLSIPSLTLTHSPSHALMIFSTSSVVLAISQPSIWHLVSCRSAWSRNPERRLQFVTPFGLYDFLVMPCPLASRMNPPFSRGSCNGF